MAIELTLDQQRAIAIARARRARAEAEAAAQQESTSDGVGGYWGQLLRSGASIAGAPVDVAKGLLDLIGLPSPERPFGGSESIRSGLAALGAQPATREPEGLMETVGATTGEAAGFLFPMLGAARKLSAGKGVTGALARGIETEFRTAPRRALAIEGLAATGAGTGRYLAEEEGLGAGEVALSEVAGGVGAALTPTGIVAAGSRLPLPMVKAARKAYDKAGEFIYRFSKTGAYDAASKRVRELVSDPMAAAQAIHDLDGTKLLPSARTGEPGLLTLERAVLEDDPATLSLFRETTSNDIQGVVDSIKRSGQVSTARDFVAAKRQRLSAALNARVEQAGRKATRQLMELDPNATPEQLGVALRESLDSALADAKAQEHLLWGAVPQDTPVPIKRLQDTVLSLTEALPLAQADDMPAIVATVMAAMDTGSGVSSLREVDGLYKHLGEVGRTARASGQFNKARISDEIRDAIMQDLDGAGTGEVKQKLQTARQFSLEVNNKFRKGAVGRILGFDKRGGYKLAEELAMESTVAKGVRGAVAVKELEAVDPSVLDEVQNFLKFKFQEQAVRNGQLVPEQTETFLRQYRPLLDNFPHLRAQIESAKDAVDVMRRVKSSAEALTSRIQRQEVSATAKFLKAPVGKEVAAVFRATDPERSMQVLVNTVKKDPSGKALEGLKTGVVEEMVERFSSSSTDFRGRNIIRGQAMLQFVTDEQHVKTLSKVFSPDELKQVQRAAQQLALYERQAKTPAAQKSIVNDFPGRVLDVLGSIIGAKTAAAFVRQMGSSAAGPSLQASQIGAREARSFLRRLTGDKAKQVLVDAVFNPDLMRQLLLHESASRGAKLQRDKVLRAYLMGTGKRLIDPEDDEQQ